MLCLVDYIQTMTISKPKNSNQIKVSVQLEEIGNMSLHISNLLRGRVVVGKFLHDYKEFYTSLFYNYGGIPFYFIGYTNCLMF